MHHPAPSAEEEIEEGEGHHDERDGGALTREHSQDHPHGHRHDDDDGRIDERLPASMSDELDDPGDEDPDCEGPPRRQDPHQGLAVVVIVASDDDKEERSEEIQPHGALHGRSLRGLLRTERLLAVLSNLRRVTADLYARAEHVGLTFAPPPLKATNIAIFCKLHRP